MKRKTAMALALSVLCLVALSGCNNKVISKVETETTGTIATTTTQEITTITTSATTTTKTPTSKKTTQKTAVQTTVNPSKLLEQQYVDAYNRTVSQNSGEFILCGSDYPAMSTYKKMTFSHKNNELIFKYFKKVIANNEYDNLVSYNGKTYFFSTGRNTFSSGTKEQYINEVGNDGITSTKPFISNMKIKNIKAGKQTKHKAPSLGYQQTPFYVNFETDNNSLCSYVKEYLANGDPIVKLTVESCFSKDKKYIQNQVIYAEQKSTTNNLAPYTSIVILMWQCKRFCVFSKK